MGIRVHKSIGYGVHPFKATEAFIDRACNQAVDVTIGEFATWCKEHQGEILRFLPGDKPEERARRKMFKSVDLLAINKRHFENNLSSLIAYDNEALDAMVLLPIAHDEWRRHDATIDWAEESMLHGQLDRFVYLNSGLYPHDKGKIPLTVAALTLWLGIPDIWPQLREALYVYWG